MRTWIGLVVVCGLGLAGAGVVAGEEKPASPKLADLAWLAGQWTSDDGGFDEHWLAPEGDAMFAVSRMVAGGKTKMCELSGIEETAEGLVFRIRHYSKTLEPWKMDADGPLTMRLVESGAKKVVFEDPKKEFPRRISYERKGDELIARLEGEKGGKPAAQEFRLKPAAKD